MQKCSEVSYENCTRTNVCKTWRKSTWSLLIEVDVKVDVRLYVCANTTERHGLNESCLIARLDASPALCYDHSAVRPYVRTLRVFNECTCSLLSSQRIYHLSFRSYNVIAVTFHFSGMIWSKTRSIRAEFELSLLVSSADGILRATSLK